MDKEYLPIHISALSLAKDVNSLVDSYTKKEVDTAVLLQWLRTWEKNCPNFMFADEKHNDFTKTLLRYCGKRRLLVVRTILAQNQDK